EVEGPLKCGAAHTSRRGPSTALRMTTGGVVGIVLGNFLPYNVSKKDGSIGGLSVIELMVARSSSFPLFKSSSSDANGNMTPSTWRKSELRLSILVGVGSMSTCKGRTSRRRLMNHVLGSI